MIDLKNIELQYFYTDNDDHLVDPNTTPVWWFNTHSPDWQYNFGTQEDVEILSIPHDPAIGLQNATVFIRFNDGLLYPNGGEANVQFGVHKTDWSNFYETDDPSYIKTMEFVENENVIKGTRNYTPNELSDLHVLITFHADVLNTDLNPNTPLSDYRRVRELLGYDPSNVPIVNALIDDDFVKALYTHPFEFWKTVLPEMNYRRIYSSGLPNTFNIYVNPGYNSGDGGHGAKHYIDWNTNPGYNITTPVGTGCFYQTVTSNQFVDRNLVYPQYLNPFLRIIDQPGSTLDQKKNAANHHWSGYRLGYGGRHEFGHGIGLWHPASGPDWYQNNLVDEKESVMHQSWNRSYNDDIVRISDIARLSDWQDASTSESYLISYPYIAKFITMQNNPNSGPQRYYYTNSYYDARYRMFETTVVNDPLTHPSRFYVLHYDSVMVSTYADEDDLRSGAPTQFEYPLGMFVDNDALAGEEGAIYVGVWAQVRKIDRFGNVTVFAGTGSEGYANGPRLSAQFDHHTNPLITDVSGNIYVCENVQNRIRKIEQSTGEVSLFA